MNRLALSALVVASLLSLPVSASADEETLFLGVGLSRGPTIPYFQAKVIAKGNTEFALGFGLRF